ncbi:MAG: hypothetical protein NT040_07295 [Bacteroidetes bacterium]|nr:hypothetical protein [Bacteroidota bacterium]
MKVVFVQEEDAVLNHHISRIINLKPVLSNYFVKDLTGFEYFMTEKSIILRKKYDDFYRVYIITTDISEIEVILSDLDGKNAINIPAKGEIDAWNNLLSLCGYDLIGVYERYYNPNTEPGEGFTASFAGPDDFEKIKSMMYGYFNPMTDWLPTDDMLQKMIQNNQVIVNVKHLELSGFFIYTFEGKKCYLNCWYDNSGDGLYLLYNVYALMKMKDIRYSYFWVNATNNYVTKIHTLLGSRPDGLKDYTFYKQTN